jgi:hypothetical protein
MTVVDGSVSYFVITLSNVPAGYDVSNRDYLGWCLDRGHNMSRSTLLNVTLYSSLNPPTPLKTKPWNQINYILNNKQGTVNDISQAIWYFMGWYYFEHLTSTAQTLVNEANAHSDFVPAFGQIVGVICLPADTNQQLSLIEVKPRCPGPSHGCYEHNANIDNEGHGSCSASHECYEHNANIDNEGRGNCSGDPHMTRARYRGMRVTLVNWFNAAVTNHRRD